MKAIDLRCEECGQSYEIGYGQGLCGCGGGLTVRYELAVGGPPEELLGGDNTEDMWRYAPLLPVRDAAHIRSMGEGGTALIRARRLGDWIGGVDLWVKDESRNPTGSWEARGYACSVSCAVEAGRTEVRAAASDQAAAACAAYSAAAGLSGRVAVAASWSPAFSVMAWAGGASGDPGPALHDPFRIEGLKTAAFEIAEQLNWASPSLIVCPSADGIIALRKGWAEMTELGWVRPEAPTIDCPAEGSLADRIDAGLEMARLSGILPSPETAGCLLGIRRLIAEGSLGHGKTAVLVNTASGMLYSNVYARRLPADAVAEADKLGGLITPR